MVTRVRSSDSRSRTPKRPSRDPPQCVPGFPPAAAAGRFPPTLRVRARFDRFDDSVFHRQSHAARTDNPQNAPRVTNLAQRAPREQSAQKIARKQRLDANPHPPARRDRLRILGRSTGIPRRPTFVAANDSRLGFDWTAYQCKAYQCNCRHGSSRRRPSVDKTSSLRGVTLSSFSNAHAIDSQLAAGVPSRAADRRLQLVPLLRHTPVSSTAPDKIFLATSLERRLR
jgi:hypothetical protein